MLVVAFVDEPSISMLEGGEDLLVDGTSSETGDGVSGSPNSSISRSI